MEDIFKKEMITPNPNFVKKFYFLDYFYILLKSVKMHSDENEILEEFKILKKKYLLGESKYKRLTAQQAIFRPNISKYGPFGIITYSCPRKCAETTLFLTVCPSI